MNNKQVTDARAAPARPSGGHRPASGERLELWLPPHWPQAEADVAWRRTTADGRSLTGRQRGLAGLAPAGHIVAWTPAAETLLLRASLPTRAPGKIVQALPYALEDQLIEPPEQQHFAFVQEPDGALAVAVTSIERMEAWTQALRDAGLQPDVLAPVTLSLPHASDAWTLAFTEHELVLRTGAHAGFGGAREAMPPAWLRLAIDEARAENRLPQRLLLVDPPADLDVGAWEQALGLPAAGPAVATTTAPERATATLNLLQHRYAPRSRWTGLWRAYRPAIVLLAVWLAGTLAIDGAELARLHWTVRAAEDEMRALLMKSFPQTTAVLDAPKQMQGGLDRLLAASTATAPGDLLALLARAAPVLEREPRLNLRAIEYADGQLVIRFTAAESAVATTLMQMLRARSLEVELQKPDASTADETRLRVRPLLSGAARRGA